MDILTLLDSAANTILKSVIDDTETQNLVRMADRLNLEYFFPPA
jgi:hypothetical protein